MSYLARPRLGFLGLGWIGRQRLKSVMTDGRAEIVAISDPSEDAVRECVKMILGTSPKVVTFEELLALDIDGIVIATPSALHAEQARLALLSGLPVFCQKPIGRNGEEVSRLISVAKSLNRLLDVDLSYRHLRGLGEIRSLVRSGDLGDIIAADLIFHNAYGPDKPWFYKASQSGGGCLLDLGVHLIDAIHWIYEKPVVDVRSHISRLGKSISQNSEEVEDYASAQLLFGSGAVCNLACSWRLHAGQDAVIQIAIYGTEGAARLANINGSFYDFRTERFTRTDRKNLVEKECEWSSGAILKWVRDLSISQCYNPEIELQITNSKVLDEIYSKARG